MATSNYVSSATGAIKKEKELQYFAQQATVQSFAAEPNGVGKEMELSLIHI